MLIIGAFLWTMGHGLVAVALHGADVQARLEQDAAPYSQPMARRGGFKKGGKKAPKATA